MARPMPLAAPVMTAVRPRRLMAQAPGSGGRGSTASSGLSTM